MAKQALKIVKGVTLANSYRYETPKKIYKLISGITNSAPVVITATAHGLPNNWRAKITNVVGMVELNSSDTYYECTKIDANTIEINDINSVGFKPYVSGGVLEYMQPLDLTGYTARMQVRPDIDSAQILLELTSANGGIVLDAANSTITISMSAEATAGLTWDKGVYSLELVSPTGTVVSFLETSNISTVKEVTR